MAEMNASCSVGVGLDVLPPEVWEMILDKLKTTQDIQNCSQVSRLFHDLLERRKTHWGFAQVLPLILRQLGGLRGVLNCRLVCRSWNDAVEKFIENCPQNRPYNGEEHDNHPLLNVCETYHPLQNLVKPVDLYSAGRVQTLHHKLQAHPQCKVIGGSFTVGCQRVENYAEMVSDLYWHHFYLFSKSFGAQISLLKLTEAFGDLQLQYIYVRLILENCPNMRKLHLDFARPYHGSAAEEEVRMEDLLPIAIPLPKMPQLESMLIGNAIWIPLKLALLDKYADQLRWLDCTLFSSIPDAVLQKMSVITELAVRINNNTADTNVTYCDAMLRKLLLIPSRKLKKLGIQMGDKQETGERGLGLSLLTLLGIIATFELKILQVGGGSLNLKLEESECPLALRRRLPSLKMLEFFDTGGVESFNFLECFPSLEQLVVKANYTYAPSSPLYLTPNGVPIISQIVNCQTIAENLNIRKNLYNGLIDEKVVYTSTLWKEMQHLKRIDFSFRCNWTNWSIHPVVTTHRIFTRNQFWKYTGF